MGQSEKQKTKSSIGCLTLFALPFAGVGVFALYLIISSAWEYHEMQSWQQVPARIDFVELKSKRGKNSYTYEVQGRYAYEWGGRQYHNNRIALHSRSDNLGTYHQRVYRQLASYRGTGRSFRCFVNPENPYEAVIFRELRWERLGFYAVFVIAFGGIGFGLLFYGVYAKKRIQHERRLLGTYPDEPWKQRQDWLSGRMKSSSKPKMIVTLVFALIWNAISSPLLFILPKEIVDKGNTAAAIGLLFPVVGLGLLVWAVRSIIQWRKFGESFLVLQTIPAVIGGPLRGVIQTSSTFVPEGGFILTLNCVHKKTSGTGKNRRTSESILLQDSRKVGRDHITHGRRGMEIPVAFAIPFDARETDNTNPRSEIIWRLGVQGAVAGVDYDTQFEVPVFHTAESRDNFHLEPAETAIYETSPQEKLMQLAGVKFHEKDNGLYIIFAPARHKGAALGLTSFAAVWVAFTVFMTKAGAPLIFPIVFSLFSMFMVLGMLDLWLYRSQLFGVPGKLYFKGGMFRQAEKVWQVEQIKAIRPEKGMQAGNKLFYGIKLQELGGKKITLAKRLDSRRQAEQLIAAINATLHKSV